MKRVTKPRHSILLCVLLVAICAALTLTAAALRAGDVVDYVLSTEIRAYIDGMEIPAYNIGGKLGVVAEDLRGYGFSVIWNGETSTLSISRDAGAPLSPVEVPPLSTEPVGTKILPVLYTEIVTDMDGTVVDSFNIDGRTIVYFSDLSVYGSYLYDNDARMSMLSTAGNSFTRVTLDTLPTKIIHAGGAIDNHVGSNSLEALNTSYAKGYRFIEMDFRFSSDGEAVCIHDWSKYYSSQLGSTPVTAAEFAKVRIYNHYTSVTLDSLAAWLGEHPDVYIITDCKDDNLTLLTKIAREYADLMPQMIPQIYQYAEYETVRALGYSNIILTLYCLPTYAEKADGAANAAFAKQHGLLAVTADATLANADFVRAFTDAGVPLFVHTVNDLSEQQRLYDLGVTCIYTDYAN